MNLPKSINARLCCLEKSVTEISDEVLGGSAQNLIEWTTAESFRIPLPVRDSDDVLTTAAVVWPDGTPGTYTTVTKNNTFLTVDAFTITYGAKTVTQPLVTRNGNGATTAVPDLIIA